MAISAAQGEALLFTVPDEPALSRAEIAWNEQSVPMVLSNGNWFAVLGVDLETKPGDHAINIVRTYADGRILRETETMTVAAREFPTTRLTVEPKYVELSDANQERTARERGEINAIYTTLTPDVYWSKPFQAPIPGTTGGRNFGHRRVFNDQPRSPHSGADLKATTGTPIEAANRGRVVLAKNLFFSGNAIFIDHGLGIYTVYLHLSETQVAEGDLVEKGQVIGLAGDTGRVTGPHLHWGARILDARVDPFSLLSLGLPAPSKRN